MARSGDDRVRGQSHCPHVIVVTANGTVRTQAVTLGKDFGATIEVLVGLNGDEQLVVNPTDDLRVLEELWIERLQLIGERGYGARARLG